MTVAPRTIVPTIDKKILLHVLNFSKFENHFEIPFALSQEGISQAIGIRRDNIPRALKRLKEEDLIFEKVVRIEGVARKRKAYFLTQKGITYSNDIKRKLEDEKVLLHNKEGNIFEIRLGDINRHLEQPLNILELIMNLTEDGVIDARKIGSKPPKPSEEIKPKTPDFVSYMSDAPRAKNFVGRKKEIGTVKKCLRSGKLNIVAVTGIAGIGKTTLVSQVLGEYEGKKNLFWYRFHKWDTLRNTLMTLAEFLAKLNKKRLKSTLTSNPNIDLREIGKILTDSLDGSNSVLVFDDFQRVEEKIAELFSMLVEVLAKIKGVKVIVIGRQILPFYDRSDVLVKNMVAEVKLIGLSRENAWELLSRKGIDRDLFNTIYKLTEGHPLFLELISTVGDIREQTDIKRYIYEEIFTRLAEEEKILLNIISVFRYPIQSSALFIDERVNIETLDLLVERNLIQQISYDEYDVHDLIREFFYLRLSPAKKENYHEAASSYYLDQGTELAIIETVYHLIRAKKFEKAAKHAATRGDQVIKKGMLEEFLAVLKNLDAEKLNPKQMGEVMLMRAKILNITGEWDEALGFYDQALLLAKKGNDELTQAEGYRMIGHILSKRNQIPMAVKQLRRSLKLSENIKDITGQADAYRGLAELNSARGKFPLAIKYAKKGLKMGKEADALDLQASIYVCLGTVYGNMGQIDRAIQYLQKGLKLLEKTGNQLEMSRVAMSLGTVYASSGDNELALTQFERCIEISESMGDIRQMGYGLTGAAESFAIQGDHETALHYLDEALDIFEKLGETFKIASTYCSYGTIYRYQKKWDDAIRYYEKGIDLLNRTEMPYFTAKAYLGFAKVFEDKGDRKKAKENRDLAQDLMAKVGAKAEEEED